MPNNRSHKRNPFRSPCTIRYVLPGGASAELVSGVTRDLSRGGLGIVVKEGLPRGTSTRDAQARALLAPDAPDIPARPTPEMPH